jgi:hypothetical protein
VEETSNHHDEDGPRDPEPLYPIPVFYGEAAATEFMGGIAAPLLAGASVAIVGVIVQQPGSLRHPGVTLFLLVLASCFLIMSVQFGFLARRHHSTPADIEQWLKPLTGDALVEQVRDDLTDDAALLGWWSDFARYAYGGGVVLLWTGIGFAVLPPADADEAAWRCAASIAAYVMAGLEVAWLAVSRLRPGWFTPRRLARRHYG